MSHLEKLVRVIGVFILLGGVAFGAFLIFAEFRKAREIAEQSCMSSIAAAVDRAWADGKLKLVERSRELTEEEVRMVFAEYNPGDCGRYEYIFPQMHIAIGDVNKTSKMRIRVWTHGGDGLSGTTDDLVIPWEENERSGYKESIF